MQFNIMLFLIAVSCVHIQSVYCMIDTALSNAGLNTKPIDTDDFEKATETISNMNKAQYSNTDDVVNALEQYAKENINRIKTYYKWDIKYSLVNANFLTNNKNYYKDTKLYHELPKTVLDDYKNKLTNIQGLDADDDIYTSINEIMEKDIKTEKKAIEHFVTCAQDYFIQQDTLQSKQPNTAIAEKVSDAKTVMHAEPAKTDVEGSIVHAVDTIITDTPVESAGVTNDLYTKLSKYMSMLKLTQHKIPIALLSTVIGIGTIGGAYYATGSTDALDTIGSDTDTEVLNDTNDTAQRHGVCIATITACTVLLALCTTTAYWIVCKQVQQHDSAYTTIDML